MAISVSDLTRQTPGDIRAWVAAIQAGGASAPDDFNWPGLAYSAARNAAKAAACGHEGDALAWASVAIAAYDYLASVHGPPDANEDERAAMFVRADMIGHFGSVPGHPILDATGIERWFLDRLPLSLDEATTMASDWTRRPIEEIRKLRGIKNRLAVLQSLVDDGYVVGNEPVRQWLRLRERLP